MVVADIVILRAGSHDVSALAEAARQTFYEIIFEYISQFSLLNYFYICFLKCS